MVVCLPACLSVGVRSMSVPLDLFCQTLEAALLKARHSVRTLTSGMAQSVRALDPTMDSSATGQAAAGDEVDFLLESWLTQIEEHHEVQGGGPCRICV